MGLLNFFSQSAPSVLRRLPSGSFTVDREGRIVASTLPASFPAAQVKEIGTLILQTFREAEAVQLPLSEVVVQYAAFKITARELRGGAIIFLAPKTLGGS